MNNEVGTKRSSSIVIKDEFKRVKTEDITEETINKLFRDKKIDEIVMSIGKIKNLDLHTKVFEKLSMFLHVNHCLLFNEVDGIKVIMETMNHYIASGLCENLVIYVCKILMTYVHTTCCTKAITQLRSICAIKAIIRAMNVHMTSTIVLNNACETLYDFIHYYNNTQTKLITDEKSIELFINIIKTHKQNVQLISNSFKILMDLINCCDSQNINSHTENIEDIIEPIVGAMFTVDKMNKKEFNKNGNDTIILRNGYKILKKLTENKNIIDKLALKIDFVSNFYDMIIKNVVHFPLLESALPILVKLVDASPVQKKQEYATFYHKICNTIILDKNEEIAYHLCVFLKILSAFIQKENITVVYINILLELIKHNINNDKILIEAVLAINKICLINNNNEIYQTGVIPILLDVINKHTNNVYLINNAYCAIFSLLNIKNKYKDEFNDRLLSFVACNGIKKVIEMMNISAQKNEPGIELKTMCNLLRISSNSVTNYALIVALGGFKILFTIIKKYIKYKNVISYFQELYYIYCSKHSKINRDVISFDDIKTIVDVMKEHIDNNLIQCGGCEIMITWTYRDIPSTDFIDFNRIDYGRQQQMIDNKNHNFKTINDAGGFTAIITAMTKYKDDIKVQECVFSMLKNYVKRIGCSAKDQVMKVFDLLIENINKHIDNDKIICHACYLLAYLCEYVDINKKPQILTNKKNQSIIKKEGLKLAIYLLEKNSNDINSICHMVYNITHDNIFHCNIKDLFGCNIIDTILSVIKINKNDVKKLFPATKLLEYLIQYNDGLKQFVMSGGISLIIDIMITHKNMYNIFLIICGLLLKVSEVEDYLLNMVLSHGTGPLITTIQEIVIIKYNNNILINLCKIINNLTKVKMIKDDIIRLNVPEWATKVKTKFKQEQGKQEQNKQEQEITVLLDTLIKLV